MERGDTQSCGCVLAETRAARKGKRSGHYYKDVYKIWKAMIARCTNSKRKNYPNYGGRGIKVCDAWLNSFEQFANDMGPRPTPAHSIDREKVDGNYEPANCRWATPTEQQNNRRCTQWIEFNGERLTLTQWARKLGLTTTALRLRFEYGWTKERAMTQIGNRAKKKPLG